MSLLFFYLFSKIGFNSRNLFWFRYLQKEKYKLPILGEVNPKNVSLPLISMVIGLVDGFKLDSEQFSVEQLTDQCLKYLNNNQEAYVVAVID